MYGYRPCKPQRILPEDTKDFRFHFLGLLVYDISAILPFKRLHCNLLLISWTLYQYIFLIEVRNDSDPSVEIPSFRRRIILDEHDLCSDLQFQAGISRIGIFRKHSLHDSIEEMRRLVYPVQLLFVIAGSNMVVGSKAYVSVLSSRDKSGIISFVESLYHICRRMTATH